MKKLRLLSLAVAAVLCAGFVSCGDDDDDEPQNPATENPGGASGDGGSTGNGSTGGNGGSGYTAANPETDEYGIAVSQEVDLGLSVNWAGWNVGATFPEGAGGYYAWGETVEKSDYDWDTYKWSRGSYDTWTKYCTVDNKTVLEPADDVASKKWGNGWRMPTEDELSELTNTNNCTWEWISYKGVNGYKVSGKRLSNGNRNSIFLPAAGFRLGTSLLGAGRGGYVWSSTLYSSDSYYAYGLYFYSSDSHGVYYRSRYGGLGVRPVKEK